METGHLCLRIGGRDRSAQTTRSFLSVLSIQGQNIVRYWPQKPVPIEQFVIPDRYVPVVLHLSHDTVFAGHQGRDKTLALARKKYYWPTLRIDMEAHVAQCIERAKHKGVIKGRGPYLTISSPRITLGRGFHRFTSITTKPFWLSRYLVLTPLHNKSAKNIAYALITHLIFPFTAPRVLLSDNGIEFRNAILEEFCIHSISNMFLQPHIIQLRTA